MYKMSDMSKKLGLVLVDDGFTPKVAELEHKAFEAWFDAGLGKCKLVYIPAGLTRLHLLALCSMTRLPIYMGNSDGQLFNAGNQSYGHTLNGHDIPCWTEKGIIEAKNVFDDADYWTEDCEQWMSVEEVLYAVFVDREDDLSPDSWCPKEKIVINCRGSEALVFYPGTGWEITDSVEGERGLKRVFISL